MSKNLEATIRLGLNPDYHGLAGNVWREKTVDYLTTAYGEGYLTPEQHSERTSLALIATTADDLREIVRDLPTEISVTETTAGHHLKLPLSIHIARFVFAGLASSIITMGLTGTLSRLCEGGTDGGMFLLAFATFIFGITTVVSFAAEIKSEEE